MKKIILLLIIIMCSCHNESEYRRTYDYVLIYNDNTTDTLLNLCFHLNLNNGCINYCTYPRHICGGECNVKSIIEINHE